MFILFLSCDNVFGALFSIVLVVLVYSVFVGLYVSYILAGIVVLFFCCFVVKELYLFIVEVLMPLSLSNSVFSTEVEIYPLGFGAVV